MKKILALAAAVGGFWALRRSSARRAEADLWAAATDSVEPGS